MFFRMAALAVGLFVVATLAILATWMWRGGIEGGLTAAARLMRHGTTTVDDFKFYPARTLQASRTPLPFRDQTTGARPPPDVELAAGKNVPLAGFLDATGTLAFLVIKDDAIVFSHYAADHSPALPSQYFSVSKSVLATLAGMAVDDGLVTSIEQPVTDFVPELADPGFRAVKLRHLANMTSGLNYAENDNPFGLHVLMNYTSALPRMILDFGLKEAPGKRLEYKSGDAALLSLALQRALGTTPITAYAQTRLWDALGMEDGGVWSLDHEGGLEKAWCCLAGSARDLAKLGRLYLSGGLVGATRVLSQRWVDEATRKLAPADKAAWGYSFSWWRPSRDGREFMASGKDGQFLFIDPAHNALIVRLGRGDGDWSMTQWTGLFRSLAAHAWFEIPPSVPDSKAAEQPRQP